MKTVKFLKPFVISLILTPFVLLAGIFSAGGGHGNYLLAKILFPYTMLSTSPFGSITAPFILLAFVQFPLYGLILGSSSERGKLFSATILLSIVHVFFVLLCFSLVNESFS